MKPSITEMEYFPPKQLPKRGLSFTEKCFIFAVLCCIVAAIVHLTIEPKGTDPIVNVAHADTKPLTDRQQEQKYCKQIATGENKVWYSNTDESIISHCAKYL